jgi:polyphosphate:AMP phosphotransferase
MTAFNGRTRAEALYMFEAAEAGRTVSKADYDSEVAKLRWELLDAQRTLRTAPFPVIAVFGGADGAGKSETLHLLNEWMDPRFIVNRAFEAPSQDERERPPFWRFWLALPPRGQIGLFMRAWYSKPLADRVARKTSVAEFDAALDRIAAFERMLADAGAIVLKFWLHLSRRERKRRLRTLSKDPLTRWRVTKAQWKEYRQYDRWTTAAERLIQRTSQGHAPWFIIDAADERYRNLAVATEIRHALYRRLGAAAASAIRKRPAKVVVASAAPAAPPAGLVSRLDRERSVLDVLDMSRTVSKAAFDATLLAEQGRLHRLQRRAQNRGRSVIMVFEGWDASGKGGAIRRLVAALPPQCYRVISTAAPTDEERARHYLWRFWRHLSRAGRVTIFDRSWYGRVLVERVEGLATEVEWNRAFSEIRQFEEELTDHGIVLIKYWLHITSEEQEKRFKERAASPYKSWKLTEEDWRNREKWGSYELAVNDMVEHTSTSQAPWHLVPANDKAYARVEVLRLASDAIERAVGKAKGGR